MPQVINAKIIENRTITNGNTITMKAVFKSEKIANEAMPGQFVNVSVTSNKNLLDPILKRPISIHDINKNEGTFSVIYTVVGKGTDLLSKACVGEKLQIVGPLGRGFDILKGKEVSHVIIGGGCGVAPLYFLAKEILKTSNKVSVFSGFSTDKAIFCKDFYYNILEQKISTDDGTYGESGFVTKLLKDYLKTSLNLKNTVIYTCGPTLMMKAVYNICKDFGIKNCQVSLENVMACGVGVCTGCVTKIKSFGKEFEYKRVCKDGPVFNGDDLLW